MYKRQIIESKKAIYPRIVIEKNVAEKATKNLTDTMIYQDSNDGKLCLNYLRAFGGNKDSCIKDIDLMLGQLTSEVNNIQKLIDDGADVEAVSYTHLDVYKRQSLSGGRTNISVAEKDKQPVRKHICRDGRGRIP